MIIKLLVIGFFSSLYILFNSGSFMIISNKNLNKQFGIVASVSSTNSVNDIIGRPLFSKEINQYYFKNNNDFVDLVVPNNGIKFSEKYNGNNLSISDHIKLKLPKYFDLFGYNIVKIDELIKKRFYFENTGSKYFNKHIFIFNSDYLNIEVNYYDTSILYSLIILDSNNYIQREANIKFGYFITLTKTYGLYNSKLTHYITRWNCRDDIKIYIDRSVPKDLITTFKNGLETWNRALYNADSRCNINAISYLDKDWNEFKNGDGRYSSISLAPSSISRTYAVGHSDFDWRNGRIYRGNIMVSGNWIDYWNSQFDFLKILLNVNLNNTCIDKKVENRYKNNFIKRGLQSVITHEMGHVLGLRHNFKASSQVDYNNIFNYQRIKKEGLIPSIMDYLNLVINFKNIKNCTTYDCIMNNTEIMDTYGKYDYNNIQFGYGNNTNINFSLGSDEVLRYDAMSNTGDISNKPGKYDTNFLKLSKYVIENFNPKTFNYNGFNTPWKIQSKLIKNYYRYLTNAIERNLKMVSSLSYTLNGDILDIKNTQKESLKFIKRVLDKKLFIKNDIYFMFPDCEVYNRYICQGIIPFDLEEDNNQILFQLKRILNSVNLKKKIMKNNKLTNKTISNDTYLSVLKLTWNQFNIYFQRN